MCWRRTAVGVRAILGGDLTPLAIKALLVHAADPGEHDPVEVGWGKIPEDTLDIITCPDGVARVVYQGELKPSKRRSAMPHPPIRRMPRPTPRPASKSSSGPTTRRSRMARATRIPRASST
ncbi:hypothetical protein G6F31_019878 [Rhizopus arrhizus]|nr:hypothetical protein G6F31_019878 [Rhizopus arrhizus]